MIDSAPLSPRARAVLALCALSGAIAVALGAFGAHAAPSPRAAEWLRTAAHWQCVHALAGLGAFMLARSIAPAVVFLAGMGAFTGALTALAAGGPAILGAVAPIGGVLYMLGWIVFAVQIFRRAA